MAKIAYKIELKAWIPHHRVVDPEEPARASDWLDSYTDVVGTIIKNLPMFPLVSPPRPEYEFQSRYHGDNHKGYDGSHRVINTVTFSFDGSTITGFSKSGNCGATHRYWSWQLWIAFAGRKWGKKTKSGKASKTATPNVTARKTGARSFTMSFAASNPLIMGPAPDIDSTLNGVFDASGALHLSYQTDLFPSHGVRVYKGGTVAKTRVINDASSVNALGVVGAANVGYRLSRQSNVGRFSV